MARDKMHKLTRRNDRKSKDAMRNIFSYVAAEKREGMEGKPRYF